MVMKKTILSLAILSCIGIAQAEYFIQIPVDVTFVKGEGQPSSPIDPEAPIEPEIDCETQAAQYPEECVEDLAAWDKFATDNGLTFDENWNGLVWRSKALTALPTEPYPNSNVFNGIDLYNNKLTNLEGFKSINSIGTNLYIYANKLNDISGLMNLQTVGGNIYLQNNQLTNVNGLNSLNYVGGSIRLDNNQLNNITGLSNAEIVRTINIDKTYAGPKLSANSRFCLLNAGPKFTTGYAKKI